MIEYGSQWSNTNVPMSLMIDTQLFVSSPPNKIHSKPVTEDQREERVFISNPSFCADFLPS